MASKVLPCALILAKLAFKYYALKTAQQSFSFGRNPRLVFGYVQQLPPTTVGEHSSPPPLLVMGEETRRVEKKPHGYVFEDVHDSGTMVTMDRVWQLDGSSMLLPAPTTQRVKDLCLSFALFKLLRCRFARYELSENNSTSILSFFWSQLLKDDDRGGGGAADRVFGVVADELSFLHDYYYSSLPISYSKLWLPIVGIVISLLSIGYCIFLVVWMIAVLNYFEWVDIEQLWCLALCRGQTQTDYTYFGNLYFDVVPLFLLSVFAVTGEAKDIISYLCSNWTKVALTRRLVSTDQHRPLCMHKWSARRLLGLGSKLMMKHWDEKMGQCSVLMMPPTSRTTPLAPVRRLLYLADDKREVSAAVKISIINALISRRNNSGQLSNGAASLRRWSQGGGAAGKRLLWACNSKSASDVILTWQIATSILEVRYPAADQQQAMTSDHHRTVATHLSRYCAYLVRWRPELLPDDDAWSKSLYEDVSKDARQALAGSPPPPPPPEYRHLVGLLSAKSKHQVVKDGVKLAEQLVEAVAGGEETMAWQLLANFWSEMVLYVAPSDNLKGHKESVARGGELITLLWAMLNHAGFVTRASRAPADRAAADDSATNSAASVV